MYYFRDEQKMEFNLHTLLFLIQATQPLIIVSLGNAIGHKCDQYWNSAPELIYINTMRFCLVGSHAGG